MAEEVACAEPAADDREDKANDERSTEETEEPDRGMKRSALATDALIGFTLTDDMELSLERLYLSIDRIEKEVDKRYVSKRPRNDSDTFSSRPSSGMSIHSESDVVSNNAEVNARTRKDLSNPLYRIPLERGWRRELVYRANLEQSGRRLADVYYYSPTGKKLRSNREVMENVSDIDLTSENFTFFKEPLGLDDPDKEIIREAKMSKSRTDSPQPRMEDDSAQHSASEGKRTPRQKPSKVLSPDSVTIGKTKTTKTKGADGKSNTDSANSSPKTRKSIDSTQKWNKSTPEPEDTQDCVRPLSNVASDKPEAATDTVTSHMEERSDLDAPDAPESLSTASEAVNINSLKKYVAPLANPIAISIANSKLNQMINQITNTVGNQMPAQMTGRDMCPMRCPLANLETPTLQCSLCLCLYHNQCTGYIPNYNTSFVCKNCHLANSNLPTTASSSQMPHLSGTRPVQKSPSVSGSSVSRFPKSSPVTKTPPQPRLVPVVTTRPKNFNQTPQKSKIDSSPLKGVQKYQRPVISNVDNKVKNPSNSVNVWSNPEKGTETKHISTVNKTYETDPTIFPQSIAILNGHKFIVVPKPNVINTSPALGTMSNPKHADNAPKLMETPHSAVGAAMKHLSTKYASDEIKEAREDNRTIHAKASSKSESFNNPPNVISFDNLSAEFGKFLFKSDPSNFSFGVPGLKRNMSSDSDEVKRKTRAPPVPKLIPKVAKKAENGTPNQKIGGRGSKAVDAKNKNYFAEFYKTNQEKGYNSIVQIFQYLKMRELAAAARVCRMWRDIADMPALWKSVRMKNSQVNDWAGLAAALKRHGTRHLDLRKMLLPPEVPEKVWNQFTEHIPSVESLIRIDLCRCPASVVERICARMAQLQALTATSVKCTELNPSPFNSLINLQELRIKGMTNITLSSDLKCLENLTKLKHLSITSVKDLGQCGCVVIGNLTSLESLELGECTGEVGGAALLRRLTSLNRLRLERCPSASGGTTLIRTAANLPLLQQLELINFDIRTGFEDALGKCTNIKRLLIIPTYVSQSATTNRCVLAGVLRLRNSLTHLMWGVTIELLRVTELFIDQCGRNQSGMVPTLDAKVPQMPLMNTVSQRNPKVIGDCVPVLKPVPSKPNEESQSPAAASRPQVEIMPLPSLQRLLSEELPETRLKLLRIPFHATWRQTFNDFD